MKQVSALELACIVKELQSLLGSYVRKISQPDHTEITLELYTKEQGKNLLRIIPPHCLYLSSIRRASPPAAYNFCMSLRKRLNNARLQSIEQKDFERIVELRFRKSEDFILIIELFSKGNIILTDSKYQIINVLMKKEWGFRTLKPQETYLYPKREGANPLLLHEEEFNNIIQHSDKDSIVKTLALNLSLGGIFAEELCARAKLDKSKKELEEEELKLLYQKFDDIRGLNISARFFKENAIPFPMMLSRHQNFLSIPSFNKALDMYYQQFMNKEEIEEEKKEDLELQKILESQKKQIERFVEEGKKHKEAGDLIYSNYAEVKELLEKVKMLKAKKYAWEKIEEELKVKIKDGQLILNLE